MGSHMSYGSHMCEEGMMPQGCAEAEGLELGALTSSQCRLTCRDHNSEPQIGTSN